MKKILFVVISLVLMWGCEGVNDPQVEDIQPKLTAQKVSLNSKQEYLQAYTFESADNVTYLFAYGGSGYDGFYADLFRFDGISFNIVQSFSHIGLVEYMDDAANRPVFKVPSNNYPDTGYDYYYFNGVQFAKLPSLGNIRRVSDSFAIMGNDIYFLGYPDETKNKAALYHFNGTNWDVLAEYPGVFDGAEYVVTDVKGGDNGLYLTFERTYNDRKVKFFSNDNTTEVLSIKEDFELFIMDNKVYGKTNSGLYRINPYASGKIEGSDFEDYRYAKVFGTENDFYISSEYKFYHFNGLRIGQINPRVDSEAFTGSFVYNTGNMFFCLNEFFSYEFTVYEVIVEN